MAGPEREIVIDVHEISSSASTAVKILKLSYT